MRWDCMNGAPDVRATRLILGCHSLTNTVTGVVPPPELLISANPVDRWTKTAGMSVAASGIWSQIGWPPPPLPNTPPPHVGTLPRLVYMLSADAPATFPLPN